MEKYSSTIFGRTMAMMLMVFGTVCGSVSSTLAQTITYYYGYGENDFVENNGTTTATQITRVVVNTNGGSFAGDPVSPNGNTWQWHLWNGDDSQKIADGWAQQGIVTFYLQTPYPLTENGTTSFVIYNNNVNDHNPKYKLNLPDGASVTQAYTISSSEGTSVDNSVSSTTINFGGAFNASYALYKGDTKIKDAYSSNTSYTFDNVSLDDGANNFVVKNGDGVECATLTVTRGAAEPPTPTGHETFDVNGSTDGKLDFSNGNITNATIHLSGLNPNAKYYLIRRPDEEATSISRKITPSADGTHTRTVTSSLKENMTLELRIDNGSGKPGDVVKSMTLTQIGNCSASLVFAKPTNGFFCGDGSALTNDNAPILTYNYDAPDGIKKISIKRNDDVVVKETTSPDPTENIYLKDITSGDYVYTLTIETNDGCTATSSANISVANYSHKTHETITICNQPSVTMNATQPAGFTGVWDGYNADGSTNPTVTVSTPKGDYHWTATHTNGCKFTETWSIVNNSPNLSEIAVSQSSNCGTSTLSVTSDNTPTWTVTRNGAAYTATPTDNNSTLVLSDAGNYTVKVSATGTNGCTQERTKSLTVNSLSGFDATAVTLTTCDGNSVSINAPSVSGASSQVWTIDGTGTISPNKSTNSINVTGLAEGETATLVWTVKKDNCSVSKTYTVQNGTVTVSGSDVLLCRGETTAKIGLSYSGSKSIVWTPAGKIASEGCTVDANDNTKCKAKGKEITINNLSPGSNTFNASVTNSNNFGCPAIPVTITVYSVQLEATATPSKVCSSTQDISLQGSDPSKYPGGVGYWTAVGGTVNASNNIGHVTGSGSAEFTWNVDVTVPGKNGADDLTCTAHKPVAVTKDNNDIPTVIDLCSEDGKATLIVPATGVTSGAFNKTNNAIGTVTPKSGSFIEATVDGLNTGTTTIAWSGTSSSGCELKTNFTIYNVKMASNPTATKKYVCSEEEQVTLDATQCGNLPGYWTYDGAGINTQTNSTAKTNVVTLKPSETSAATTMYWNVKHTTANGDECTAKAGVTVENLYVNPNPGVDDEICNYEDNQPKESWNTYTMKATPLPTTTPATTGKWTTTTSGVIIEESEATKHDAKINNLASGINVFTWTVTRQTSDGSGICKRSRDVTIYNSAVSKAETSADIYTCEDFTNDLSATKAMDGTGAWTLQSGHGYFNKSSADDTPIGTHEVYETQQITYAEAPYKNQKFIIRADVYNYDYNETQDIVYTYYLLTGSERSVFTDGTASAKMLTSAGDFTASESNRISSENLYDKTYTLNPKVVRLQAGKNTFRWEVSKNQLPGGNGCSNYKDVNVYYLPVQVEAGDPQFLCTNYGALQGSMSEVTFTNIEDIRWEKEWTTNSGAVIEDPENLYSPVTNLAATWNKFTLHAIVYHKDQLICDASDDVIIWNDDVGDVNAGQDDVDCGTVTNGGKLDGSYQSYIGEYHSLTADVSHLLHNGIGVKGEWSVIGGGVDQIEFGDRYSNVTSVKNLQRYMQDCTEGYWSQQGVSNQFRWTVTYTNPETGHTCSKYDDVQITWLAPGDPDAGEDQLVCSDYVDLAPGDQGCGAEKTWWAFPGSAANSGMNVDESKWSNPYWGGNSYLVADQRDLLLDETEKKKMVAAYGLEEATWNKKDRLVYSDVSYLDGRYYRIQSVRQTYKNSSGSIIYVDVSYAAYECEADGKVAGKDVKQEILDTDNATAVNPENYGKQLSLYQIADEVSNVAIYAQPTPANKEKLNSVNFRWYKNNQLYSPKKGYVVSCTSWDEVKIDYLGGMMDVFAGNEQVVCAENETVHLDATDRGVTFDITKTAEITVDGVTKDVPYSDKNPNYRIYLLGNAWEVVEGAGTFTNKSSKSTIVTNLGMGTNIYRWTATLMVEGKTGTTDIPLQQCTSTDDVYVTNASPSQAAVGDDREECSEITSISANLPVRSTGSFWVAEAGGAYITKQEIKDQQVSAYVTNMKLGVNTFTFHVLNYYESPKNPEVAKVCESTASISLYYHKLPADAGFDQFICVDEVTLKGNDLSITFEDDGKTVASCGFAEKGSFGPLDRDADGYITRLPHGKWYQAMTNDQYFYKASDPDSEASIGSTSVSNVIVKPLSHDFNKFHWQVTWGNCVSEDEVDVYVNMPTPTPNAGLDRATCSDEIDLAANNANNKGRQEWRSLDKNGVTLAPADEMSCHVSGLSSGLDNTFYWAFYREKLDQYPGMLPDQLRKYLEEVKKYTQNVKKYTEYVGYLEDYNARLATYESEMTAYNEYVRKLKEYVNYVNCRGDKLKISLGYSGIEDPGDCETQYTQKTKPAEVQMPARLQEPPYVAAPVDTSASNTTAPWAGLGLWNYYVKLSQDAAKADPSKYEKVYAREGEGVIQGEKLHEKDGMYYLECYMEDDVVIHSNSISVKASDYAACDYFVIKDDGKSTETSNNVFVTCANKDAIINSHSVGRREHSLETTSVGFSPAVNPEALQTGFTGKRGTATTERAALRERLSSEAVSGIGVTRDVDYSKYGVLWTQISGPKDLTIEGAATMFPKVSDAVDGSYEFQVYAVRMNGPTDYCESTQKVKVDIHIPTMAVLEARYQGIGDWTINRVAMCNDEIDLQWMSATGITFTPNSTLEEGSTLAPGKINEVPNNTEYSILRLVNGDGGGNSITFSKNSYVSGTPGRSEYKASGLPYNGTGFELFNCINYIDRNGKQQYCATSDTIPIFNNSVYADADVRIDPDKSQKGYQWVKQEVNICEDTYELEANDPHGFDGNKDLVQYETYGMWGFDDKDFKGYYVGEMPLLDGTSLYGTVTKFNPTATNLVKSDNHQRPNAFIWCVYKSIIPPYCKKDDEDICNNTMPENTYAPMYVYCADGKTYKDFYENDNGRIYWYPTDDKGNLVTNGDRYFQVAYTTKCDDVVRYGYIKTGTQPVACDADNKNIINATYVINKKELTGASICINFADLVDLRKEAQYGILPNDIYDMSGCKSEVENVSPKRCNKFYMQDDIDNASGEIADKMRRWNAMSYLRNSSGGISVTSGQYRHQYNYYVTMNDNDEYVYLWSDRETHGKPTGGIEYECVATDGTISKTLLTYKDNGYDGWWGYTYFKGADMLYVSPERKAQFMLENTFQKDGKTCYPLAYDGGWKRDAPKVDKSGSNKSYYSDFTRGLASYPDWKQCVLEDNLETHTPIKSGNCGLCSGTFHVFFVTSAIGNYGEPIKIPLTFLKEYNGVRAKFFEEDEIPKGIQGVTFDNTYEKEDATYFACKKGDVICNESREGALAYDVPKMPGYKYAYHVSGWRWDDDAIRAFGADIQQDISHNIAEKSEPIQSTATNVDEIKEETDNPNKNYWCTARDTVFIYNNQFVVEENMPYFVVCSDEAQLKGEEPGGAAEANASGYWTVETNKEDVTIESPSNFVTNVTGLPPGETQFKWHLTRWTCNADKDVFVYYNKVESEAGDDVYTCSDEATLGAAEPQSPATGHWRVTESTGSKTTFDNINKFDATVSKLKQGDNPFVWVVENPMPPMQQKLDENGDPVYDADGNPVMESSGKIEGRTYHIQKKCTAEDQMMVHDLRPDDAIINTGKEITPNPSPRP